MTTYSTNFSGYTVDVSPSDWTARWVTASNTWAVRSKASVEGGKTLENTGTVDGRHLLSWNVVDADANRANVEILARVRSSSVTAEQFRLTVRGSGTAAAETGYNILFDTTSSDFRLHKYVAGVSTNLGTAVNYTQVANTWYYVRFRANGSELMAKVWKEIEVEPTDWTITATDSAITAAGWIGVGNLESTGTRDFDLVTIGTNGDTAPLSTSTATSIRSHQDVLEAGLATVANARTQQAVLEVAMGESVLGHAHQVVLEVAIAQATAVTQQPRMIVLM